MILNVSGRCDIIAFYSDWFFNRLKEGFFDVRNPFNPRLVSRIYKEDIDMYVFCTKNPIPSLDYISSIDKPILYMVTITGYKEDIEPGVKHKDKIVEAVKKLADIIGPENVYLRYDPILLNDKYTIYYHEKALDKLMNELKNSISKVIFSFMDNYKNTKENENILKAHEPKEDELIYLQKVFTNLEEKYKIPIEACSEDKYLSYGFKRGICVSQKLAFEKTGKVFPLWKERDCLCARIVDIGVYNTCMHYCKYCYANFNEKSIKENVLLHDKNSSLLIGNLKDDDIIKRRID